MAVIRNNQGEPVAISWRTSEIGRKRKPPVDREHHEQVALFNWAKLQGKKIPELALLFAIPNGGKRSPRTAGRLKAEGVKAGVPDICLPVARSRFHGLYVELKAPGGKATDSQSAWMKALAAQGYCVHLCFGWEAARKVIEAYLDGRLSYSGLFDDAA